MDKPQLTEKQQRTLAFVRIRWFSILLILAVTLFLAFVAGFQIPFWACLLVAIIASAYNLSFTYLTHRFLAFSENDTVVFLRASADLIVVAILIHLTGGVESPFILLFPLELTTVAIFGLSRLAYLLAAQATILYLINSYAEAYFILPHYRLAHTPGTLYLSADYIVSKSFTLFASLILISYLASFLGGILTRKQQQIEELSNARFDFMNVVMHEAKSPLTSIIGYLDLIRAQKLGPVAETQQEPLAVIKRSSQRILSMINDLLDLTRLELGKVKLDLKQSNLADLASRVIEEFRPTFDARKIKLIEEFDRHTPQVMIDEDKIYEVFTNLLSNALKFSNDGGRIFFSIAPFEQGATVSVRDEGLGIAPEDQPHIFEKFYRSSKESAERKGTGLGLPICRQIIEMHGGRIWAVSGGRDQGAVVYFTLPG